MTRHKSKKSRNKHLHPSDFRSVVQLATHATVGVVDIAEGVHQSVLNTLGIPGGIVGMLYRGIRGVTQLVGQGLDTALARLQPLLEPYPSGTRQREAVLAALNGVMGDHLAATQNTLAIPMRLLHRDEALNWEVLPPGFEPTGKILLLIHGLCMNDLQWRNAQGFGHGEFLAGSLGYTPVYLRYNSGLHISQNGRQFSAQLEQLVSHWPVPIEEVSVLAHSMGGLVTRSAIHYASQDGLRWPTLLKSIIFLGTPHHGAPLERAGNWFHVLLGKTPYTAPFSKLGKLRSAGITDLRYGHLVDEDWHGRDRFHPAPDNRQPVPLPEGVACYAIAAIMTPDRHVVGDVVLGDGLVPPRSALGQHEDEHWNLTFPEDSQWVAYRMNHMGLLSSPEVALRLQTWLAVRSPT